MPLKATDIPADLIAALRYDPETGTFTWRIAPSRKIKAGARAGWRDADGYLHIRWRGCLYLAHRVAWAWVYGELSVDVEIDHKEAVDDERIANLRLADRTKNMINTRIAKNNKSGYKGVSYRTDLGKYRAVIGVKGKQKFLGYFDDPAEAHQAYINEARKLHGEYARSR